jgi:hypothetical protein
MANSDTIEYKPPVQLPQQLSSPPHFREDNILHATKRNRLSIKKEFPISKLLGKR